MLRTRVEPEELVEAGKLDKRGLEEFGGPERAGSRQEKNNTPEISESITILTQRHKLVV
jgi:hypothetical protein